MESISVNKHQKVIDVHNMSETPDRISALPESIILFILSFLPTKYVVQTSILSRRWRYLWTSIPTLDFDDDLFPFIKVRNGYLRENMKFVNFVDTVLQFHSMSNINKFRLACLDCDISRANTWISVAIENNVQELYLDIPKNAIQFPVCLFTCKSLVLLKLNLYCSYLSLPDSISFTSLSTLHLDSVIFSENDSIRKLLSSCPLLENLIMIGCGWGDHEVVEISSPTVRNLSIDGSPWGICVDGIVSDCNIKISIPNLISLKYIDYLAEDYSLENLSSLVDAFIDVRIGRTYWNGRYKESGYRMNKLLRGVSSARSLTLSDSSLELLSDAPNLMESLPTFHNLNKLILTSGRNKKHFLVIACLLQSSPVLESLVIDIEPCPYYEYHFNNKEGQDSKKLCVECHFDHLKVVKIRCFGSTEDELEFVKVLLRNSSTMERLVIIKGEDSDQRMEINEKLLMFQRASASCIISLLQKL